MKEKFYTVDQIAEMLEMHPKTIRKFIREGKLRANKVGKQWRITGNDLSNFTEGNKTSISNITGTKNDETYTVEEMTSTNFQKANVSAVVDIIVEDKEESTRISNTLIAVMNSKDPKYGKSTINIQYIENDNKIRVMLWGTISFVETMLSCISVLINQNE